MSGALLITLTKNQQENNMSVGDKYHAAETSYVADEAEYDAADYNFQIVTHSDDVVCLCPNREIMEHIRALLNANPMPSEQ
jgi:Rad3-related DNA helicase